jgi:hypothetical protein
MTNMCRSSRSRDTPSFGSRDSDFDGDRDRSPRDLADRGRERERAGKNYYGERSPRGSESGRSPRDGDSGGRGGGYEKNRGRDDFAGRGRGDGGRGRGDAGRGRGGGGKNRHMGDDFNFQRNLFDSPGLSSKVILDIINIPDVEKEVRAEKPIAEGIPPLAGWRMVPNVGYRVRDSIISNHFKVNVSNIPQYFHHYDVKIQKCDKDGQIIDDNVAREGDVVTNTIIVKSVYYQHPSWKARGIGFSYDGRSSLFSTEKLPSVIDISENANVVDADLSSVVENEISSTVILVGSKYPYRVELQYTNCVGPMPENGPGGESSWNMHSSLSY